MLPEEQVIHQDPYAIDAKLDFLCGLRLLPTPLIKECPNATKKWLKATTQTPVIQEEMIGTGINSFDVPDYLSHSVHFESVFINANYDISNDKIMGTNDINTSEGCQPSTSVGITNVSTHELEFEETPVLNSRDEVVAKTPDGKTNFSVDPEDNSTGIITNEYSKSINT